MITKQAKSHTHRDINIDNYAVRCFVFKFALEPISQIQENDQDANKGSVFVLFNEMSFLS